MQKPLSARNASSESVGRGAINYDNADGANRFTTCLDCNFRQPNGQKVDITKSSTLRAVCMQIVASIMAGIAHTTVIALAEIVQKDMTSLAPAFLEENLPVILFELAFDYRTTTSSRFFTPNWIT
jgi:hypothetical protein